MRVKLNLAPLMANSNIKSVSELSRITGISRPTLYKHAKGEAKVIENRTIEKLCNAFNCEIKDILKLERGVMN